MANRCDPILRTVPIRSLRPTQLTVGLIEVEQPSAIPGAIKKTRASSLVDT